MFSLIITVVAIALMVALVLAVVFYGGTDTLERGQREAEVVRSLNELAQIKGALTAYHAATGKHAASLQDLVPNQLSSVPTGWGGAVPSQLAFESTRLLQGTETQKLDSCRTINTKLGMPPEPPSCADITSTFSGCCVVPTGS